MKKIILLFIISLFYVLSAIASAQSADGQFRIKIGIGRLSPNDWQVQGVSQSDFNIYDFSPESQGLGFGHGNEISISGEYVINSWGYQLNFIRRTHSNRNINIRTMTMDNIIYGGDLDIITSEINIIRYVRPLSDKFIPYLGLGLNFTLAKITRNFERRMLSRDETQEGTAISTGFNIISGVSYTLPYKTFLDFSLAYSFSESDWNLDVLESESNSVQMQNMNIGGTSMKISLGKTL